MLSHTQSKERVENTFKALGGLWENLFDLFAAEVVKVIDARQEDALTMMRGQGESIIKDILASSGGLVKQKPSITNSVESSVKNKSRKEGERGRSRDLVQQNPANASYDSGHGDSRGNKRRRLASHTTCDAGTSGQPQPPMLGDIVLDERVKDILEEMKSKIDRQARSLEYLTKENKLVSPNHADTFNNYNLLRCRSKSSRLPYEPNNQTPYFRPRALRPVFHSPITTHLENLKPTLGLSNRGNVQPSDSIIYGLPYEKNTRAPPDHQLFHLHLRLASFSIFLYPQQ
jgi:hypothetical protein